MSGIELGLIGGGVSALATTLGALVILAKNSKFGHILEKVNMDFVIGLMLAAAAFSLIVPAYESSASINHIMLVSLALVTGVLFIKFAGELFEKTLKNNKFLKGHKRSVLFVLAMMIHNFPEGLASGASMTLPGTQGYSILGAIALQNVPEGFTTGLSFLTLGLSPVMAFLGVLMTAFVELFGGLIGGYLTLQIKELLPLFMAFAGGAMMNVVLHELVEKVKIEKATFLIKPGFLSGVALVLLFNKL